MVVRPIYLLQLSSASFDSIDHEMVTILHQEYSDHTKFFVAECYGVNSLFPRSVFRDLLIIQTLYWQVFFCISFTFLSLIATMMLERFVICCLGMFNGPKNCFSAYILSLIMLFSSKTSLLLTLHRVFCIHYLLKKVNLYLRVYTLLYKSLFVIQKMLFLSVLAI